MSAAEARRWTPYAAARDPALLLFVGVVLVPMAMTVLLSFHDWGQYKGIDPVLILKNWRESGRTAISTRCSLRTFRIALLVTLITAVLGSTRGLHPEPHARALARHLPAGGAGAPADLGGGAHARLGAAVRRLERGRSTRR